MLIQNKCYYLGNGAKLKMYNLRNAILDILQFNRVFCLWTSCNTSLARWTLETGDIISHIDDTNTTCLCVIVELCWRYFYSLHEELPSEHL